MANDKIIVDGETYLSPKAIVKTVNDVLRRSFGVHRRVAVPRPAVTGASRPGVQGDESARVTRAPNRRRGRPAGSRNHVEVPAAPQNGAAE